MQLLHELLEEKFRGERDKDFRGLTGNCRCLFACLKLHY